MLFTIIKYVREYGDSNKEDGRGFLKSCGILKQEIDHTRIKLLRIKNIFMGMFLVLFLPFLSLGLIKKWGVETLPELSSMYCGVYGACITFILFLLSLGAYLLFYALRNRICDIKNTKSEILHISLKNFDMAVVKFVKKNPDKTKRYEDKLKYYSSCMELYDFVRLILICNMLGFISMLIFLILLRENSIISIITCSAAVFVFFNKLPDLWLLFCSFTAKKRTDDEILRLFGIVNILKDMEGITVYGIIEALEEVAVIYKPYLRSCLLFMVSDEREALKKLLAECINEREMVRLCESIMLCDNYGIRAALNGIEQERKFSYEINIEKEGNSMKNVSAFANFLTFIPISSVIIFYLIVPFIYVSLGELSKITMVIRQPL